MNWQGAPRALALYLDKPASVTGHHKQELHLVRLDSIAKPVTDVIDLNKRKAGNQEQWKRPPSGHWASSSSSAAPRAGESPF